MSETDTKRAMWKIYSSTEESMFNWSATVNPRRVGNQYHEVPKVRWGDLRNRRHLADGAMCSCYTAELEGVTVVVKRPNKNSREVG